MPRSSRLQDWRESLSIEWTLRDEGWWVGPLLGVLFFATPVVMGLVFAFVLHEWWLLLVLVWPAIWILMWAFPG